MTLVERSSDANRKLRRAAALDQLDQRVHVAAWLAGIIFNLLTRSGYYDIALRDFGLMVGALSLGRLAAIYDAH